MATVITSEKMSGFLDGYMSGNLSSNASELKYHTEKVNTFIDEIKNNIVIQVPDKDQIKELLTSIDTFLNKSVIEMHQ